MDSENTPSISYSKRSSKLKNLTADERNGLLQHLLQRSKDGTTLSRGAILEDAPKFEVSRQTISKVWKKAKIQFNKGNIYADVSSNKNKCGRKRKNYSKNFNQMKEIPLNHRGTIRSLSCAIDVPKSTLFERFKEGNILKRISSTVKPILTDRNKQARLQFSLSKVKPDGYFEDLFNYVHIDEKWFYLTKEKRSYYVTLDEELPERTCKSKRFISKVMFMAAVARPRYDHAKKQYFDGKIGLWPFIYKEPAKRTSKNRTKER